MEGCREKRKLEFHMSREEKIGALALAEAK